MNPLAESRIQRVHLNLADERQHVSVLKLKLGLFVPGMSARENVLCFRIQHGSSLWLSTSRKHHVDIYWHIICGFWLILAPKYYIITCCVYMFPSSGGDRVHLCENGDNQLQFLFPFPVADERGCMMRSRCMVAPLRWDTNGVLITPEQNWL